MKFKKIKSQVIFILMLVVTIGIMLIMWQGKNVNAGYQIACSNCTVGAAYFEELIGTDHIFLCKNCSARTTITGHAGADCFNGGLCKYCEVLYETHSMEEISYEPYTNNKHTEVYVCDCGKTTKFVVDHEGGSCSNKGKCTKCGTQYETHTLTVEGYVDEENGETHQIVYKCSCGKTETSWARHSGASHYNGGKCEFCNAQIEIHNIEEDYTVNENGTTHKIISKCSCGWEKEEDEQHSWITKAAKSATCTEDGLTRGTECEYCSYVETAQVKVPAKGHIEVTDAAVAATCEAAGKTEGKHCAVCGTVTVAQETIPAKGHTEVTDAAVVATCTTEGKTEGKHCSTCGTVTVAQTTIPAKGHTEVTDAAVAATCEAAGKTEGKHCSVCNTVTVAQTTIPAKGHTEVTDAAVAATCEAAGKTEGKHCSTCGTVIVAQTTIPAKGHTEVTDAAVAATCEAEGKTEGKHCSVCDTVIVAQETIPALGHSFINYVSDNNATCTKDGTETAKCERCTQTKTRTKDGSKIPHNYKNGQCTMCGAKTTKIEITSEKYEIKETYITKIQPKTKVEDLIKNITTNAEANVYTAKKVKVEKNSLAGTGMIIEFKLGSETKTFSLVVAGDTNGDGQIKLSDMTVVNRCRLHRATLKGEFLLAGDVTEDGKVDFKDIVKINRYRLNKIKEL